MSSSPCSFSASTLPIGTAPRGIASTSGFLPRKPCSAAASCTAASARSRKRIGPSARPAHAQQVVGLVVVELHAAPVGFAQGFADAPREVRVGGGHQQPASLGDDVHDPL